MRERCLIITGTVVPNVVLVRYDDPAIRRQQYLKVLSFYLETLDDPIYFLENSSYDFSRDDDFQRLFYERGIELVKFPVSHEVERGKGLQEFEMIDEAVKSLSRQYYSFIKVSRRYQYLNIKKLTDFRCEGLIIDMSRRFKVAITSIFYTTFAFYQENLVDLYLEVDDSRGQWIERRLYKRLKNEGLCRYVHLFPTSPALWIPYSTRGSEIDTTRGKLMYHIRNIERIILRRFAVNELYL